MVFEKKINGHQSADPESALLRPSYRRHWLPARSIRLETSLLTNRQPPSTTESLNYLGRFEAATLLVLEVDTGTIAV